MKPSQHTVVESLTLIAHAPWAEARILQLMFDHRIWRSATELLGQYGCDAAFEAGLRADERVECGDCNGAAHWLRVVEAVEELQRPEGAGDRLH